MHIGPKGHLYGLHSFRVGGAQALALAGRSVLYIMSRDRWKSSESVARYVAAPAYVQCADASDMSLTGEQRRTNRLLQKMEAWHTNLENGEVLVGSPLCKCPLPLSSTTSALKALKTHYVQAPRDTKLKLHSSYLYDNGSPQLISDQLMTYSDGHHNLNCAKLKQAKLKLKLCKN